MDNTLFQALKKGKRDAFDDLFRTYYPKLMGYTRLLVSEEIARDIVQDVFLYIWEQRARLEYGEKFRSYLFQRCYTRAIDYLRHEKLVQTVFSPQAEQLLTTELNWMRQNHNDIIGNIMSKELMERIEQLIDQLPEKRREVFKLSFMHDMSSSEISKALDIPQRTVESHLYLTLKFLRKYLTSEEFCSIMLFALFRI